MNAQAMSGTAHHSFLHRWDPRLKLVALLLLAFTFSFIDNLRVLPAMVGITLAIVLLSGYPLRLLLRRLRYPSLIVLFLVLLLPFISGYTALLEWRGLRVTTEGLQAALLVTTRFFCILSLAVVFLGTTPLLVNIKAIQAMGLPYIMADMALLVVRYIEVLSADLRRMRISMRLRGHAEQSFSWKNLRTMAWLTGSLILRSYERSQSVYKAMRLRGYGHVDARPDEFKATRTDIACLCAVSAAVLMLVLLEFRL
ncbi:cobalt/nickel transport system permease protein [Desulfonatronum thiosulfatophilum]|uniref:Cobalt/nickel transport system permease protein n=1 Tax=Desulfonatronum thiosulfatophilum TaxID=617002 RepID=A0A1G6AHL0_9BACT|nr:cobalt ECF transporter T component CbiQ [Desulfonatronum thiosulfatophilum]SDB07897.1 cobalt/nickel transport system permease protein [Desulfonatronum thiosulfatophilum]